MENENGNGNGIGEGKQRDLEELEAEIEQERKERQKNSRFLIVDPGKAKILTFTGRVFERTAIIEGKPSDKLDFELEEKTPSGENKVFSVGKNSETARQLIKLLKEGKRVFSISRTGEKTATRYVISEVQ